MDDVHNNRHASELLHRFEASDSEGFSVVRGYAAMSAAVVVVSIAWAVAGEGASHFVWCFLLIILAALWLEPILSIPHTIELEEKRIVLRGPHETKHLIDMRGVTDVRMIEGTELWVRSIFAACCMTHCYVTDNTKAVLVHSDAMGRWQWSYIVSVTEPELLVLMGKEAAIVERQEELMRLTTQPKYVQAAKTLGSTDVMKMMYQHFYADAETKTETASRPDVDSEPEPAPESEPAPGQDVDSESKSYPTEGEGEPPLQLPGDKIAQGTEEPAPEVDGQESQKAAEQLTDSNVSVGEEEKEPAPEVDGQESQKAAEQLTDSNVSVGEEEKEPAPEVDGQESQKAVKES